MKNEDYSVITDKIIRKGEVVLKLDGVITSKANKYSIQISKNQHLQPPTNHAYELKKLKWPYLNHSCNPNSFVNIKTLEIISLRDINANEEITFDYEETELILDAPFMCRCGEKNCRKEIKGKYFRN